MHEVLPVAPYTLEHTLRKTMLWCPCAQHSYGTCTWLRTAQNMNVEPPQPWPWSMDRTEQATIARVPPVPHVTLLMVRTTLPSTHRRGHAACCTLATLVSECPSSPSTRVESGGGARPAPSADWAGSARVHGAPASARFQARMTQTEDADGHGPVLCPRTLAR